MTAAEDGAIAGRLAIVGGGVMGRAIGEAVLAAGLVGADRVAVAEPDEERRRSLAEALGVTTAPAAPAIVGGASLVLLAVKPQVFRQVAGQLRGTLPARALVVSIMAGITTDAMSAALAHPAIVRAMPNAAARVRRSTTVWYAPPAVPPQQRAVAEALLAAIGEAIEVKSEAMLDMATAVSGSGPAFVCLMVEALVEAAVAVGFSREVGQRLVQHTLAGTSELLAQSGAHPALIRESVTSPAGTTAAGLQALEARAVRAAFVEAVQAAHRRAKELGG